MSTELQAILTRNIEDADLVVTILAVADWLCGKRRNPHWRRRAFGAYVAALEHQYGFERIERLLGRAERLREPIPEPHK